MNACLNAIRFRLMAALARDGGCIAFQTLFGIERDIAEKTLVFIPLGRPQASAQPADPGAPPRP